MSPLRIQVPAREVRVGDEIEVGNVRGIVSAIHDHRERVSFTVDSIWRVLARAEETVTVTLEDDGR